MQQTHMDFIAAVEQERDNAILECNAALQALSAAEDTAEDLRQTIFLQQEQYRELRAQMESRKQEHVALTVQTAQTQTPQTELSSPGKQSLNAHESPHARILRSGSPCIAVSPLNGPMDKSPPMYLDRSENAPMTPRTANNMLQMSVDALNVAEHASAKAKEAAGKSFLNPGIPSSVVHAVAIPWGHSLFASFNPCTT